VSKSLRETADAWVFDPTFTYVLLVRHRVHGWVPPGGKAEVGETPEATAIRELHEETGIANRPIDDDVHVIVGPLPGGDDCITRSFTFVVDRDTPLVSEPGQPARWFSLDDTWESIYPHDRDNLRARAVRLASDR
jgi:8-oxo-dGTP diphosphatase